MKLEIGKHYARADGHVEYIAGVTRDHPEIFYSRGGNWFEAETGRAHGFKTPTWRDLVREVNENGGAK